MIIQGVFCLQGLDISRFKVYNVKYRKCLVDYRKEE